MYIKAQPMDKVNDMHKLKYRVTCENIFAWEGKNSHSFRRPQIVHHWIGK